MHKEIVKILKGAQYKNYILIEMKYQEHIGDVKRAMDDIDQLSK